MFQCQYCDKSFTRKYGLDCHLAKSKVKCYEKLNYKTVFKKGRELFCCPKCPKNYTRKQYLEEHAHKTHPELYTQSLIIKEEIDKELKMVALENKVKELEQKLGGNQNISINITNNINSNNVNSNNVNNTQNNTQNNNNIQNNAVKVNVRPYSYENDSYITDEILDECVKNPFEGVVRLTKMINFNENHPENFNIYMNNKKKREISFFNNEKWVKRDKKSALNFIFNTQTDRIGEHLDKHPERFKEDRAFIENILHVILQIETHDKKMIKNEHYRNLVNNIFKIIEDNNDKVINGLKNKIIKVKNQDAEMNYDTGKTPICVPLFLEPTKIID